MLNKAFKDALEIIETLTTNGYETYFVGGCVRDTLLGKQIKDIDIATAASPEIVSDLFEKVIPVGLEHGTVIVRLAGESYEVTTFRKDGAYSDQRRPDDVEFVTDIAEDLKRRDFTMNALAMTSKGEIIDLFAGERALGNKQIVTVGKASKRFTEDPLRIIRALRFASVLGFTIEEKTLTEMKNLKSLVESLAIERLTNEFERFFTGEYIFKGIEYLKMTGLLHHLPIFKDDIKLINYLPENITPFISFAEVIAFFHHYEKNVSITDWAKSWKTSNKVKNEAINLTNGLSNYFNKGLDNWLIYQLADENFTAFVHLVNLVDKQADIELSELKKGQHTLQIQKRSDIKINGNDLLEICAPIKAGPWMNEMFKQIEKCIVIGRLANDKNAIKEWILCNPPEIN